jgi:DNA-binding response OmpR family regulator
MPLSRKRRILVLDDEPHIQDLLVRGLSTQGYAVKATSEFSDALRTLGWFDTRAGARGWDPDLLIMDWKMPGCDGTELLHVLRSDPRFVDLSVLLLGQRSPLYDTRRYLEGLPWRAQAYLYKPFSLPELLPLVAELLASRKD